MAHPFPGCASGSNGNKVEEIARQVSGVVQSVQSFRGPFRVAEWMDILARTLLAIQSM